MCNSFQEMMHQWDQQLISERKEKIKSMLDNGNLILFFSKDGEFFGCPEESRLVFAKIKNPDEDVTPAWADEAAFMAYNLSKALTVDEIPQRLFYKPDISNIEILDRDKLEKMLLGKK